jgi:GLPGLI family protein
MKSFIRIFLVLVGMMGGVGCGHTQTKLTEGRIVYEVKYPNSINKHYIDSSMLKQEIVWFKRKIEKIDWIVNDSIEYSTLYDIKAKIITMIMKYPKGNLAIISNEEDYERGMGKPPKGVFKYTSDTKMICGYKCNKAEYLATGDTTKHYVYYTKEITFKIPYFLKNPFEGLEGFPMEYNTNYGNAQTTTLVTSVCFDKIDDSIFEIPKGYEKIYPYKKKK